MKKISLWLLCAGLLLPSLVNGQSNIEFREFQLENGLTVILHQDQSTPIVAVSVMYHVGSKDEKPDRTGFAHFFEHLLFEGTENIGRGEFMKKIESIGGTLNAFTSKDITYYHEVVPSNHLETALYMESERMLHAKIDEVGISTQRRVIKEEKMETMDNRPYGTIAKEIFNRTHQLHPYNWPIIGETEHLDAATLEEFLDFYKTYYVPNNAVLSIAGDLDYEQTESWVRKYFDEIPKGTKPIIRSSVQEPERDREIRDVIHDNIQLPAVILAYNLPPIVHSDIPALEMLAYYLTGGRSAVLHRELVDRQQKALGVVAVPNILEDGGVFFLYGISNMGVNVDTLEHAIITQIDTVLKNGISQEDLEKVRAQVETNLVGEMGSVALMARKLAEAKTFFGDTSEINDSLHKYERVSVKDILRVANRYLSINNRVVLHYVPIKI